MVILPNHSLRGKTPPPGVREKKKKRTSKRKTLNPNNNRGYAPVTGGANRKKKTGVRFAKGGTRNTRYASKKKTQNNDPHGTDWALLIIDARKAGEDPSMAFLANGKREPRNQKKMRGKSEIQRINNTEPNQSESRGATASGRRRLDLTTARN